MAAVHLYLNSATKFYNVVEWMNDAWNEELRGTKSIRCQKDYAESRKAMGRPNEMLALVNAGSRPKEYQRLLGNRPDGTRDRRRCLLQWAPIDYVLAHITAGPGVAWSRLVGVAPPRPLSEGFRFYA
jgi:hypothetical protein